MGLAARFQAALALVSGGSPPLIAQMSALTPRQKAALVVVSGLPGPNGVAGVLVQQWSRNKPIPRRAIVFTDPGGRKRELLRRAPARGGSSIVPEHSGRLFLGAGDGTRARPRRCGRRPRSRPRPGGRAPRLPPPRLPGLRARVRPWAFHRWHGALREALPRARVGAHLHRRVAAGPCTSPPRGARGVRARDRGFRGVAITDSVSVFGSAWAVPAVRLAVRAGADLVLLTNGRDAARVVRALLPLARRGLLEEHVQRVLAFRRQLGLRVLP